MTQPAIVNDSNEAAEEERVLRWGGVAGVLGTAMLLGAFIVVGALSLPDTSDTASLLDFPDIETARIAENTLYLGALVLWTLHFIALQLALRKASLAPSPFGSALGIFGLVMLAAGPLLHVATGVLSDLYHSSSQRHRVQGCRCAGSGQACRSRRLTRRCEGSSAGRRGVDDD